LTETASLISARTATSLTVLGLLVGLANAPAGWATVAATAIGTVLVRAQPSLGPVFSESDVSRSGGIAKKAPDAAARFGELSVDSTVISPDFATNRGFWKPVGYIGHVVLRTGSVTASGPVVLQHGFLDLVDRAAFHGLVAWAFAVGHVMYGAGLGLIAARRRSCPGSDLGARGNDVRLSPPSTGR
jgi:hypothetical protein